VNRLDQELVARGLCDSRERARRLIMAGVVRLNGQPAPKPGAAARASDRIELLTTERYVSRGGEKLAHALDHFALEVRGTVALDVGAATGGFTDCLLQHGAAKVYAVDVGHGQLAWRLRQDPRVVVMEKTNARQMASLPEEVNLVTIDASFISLKILLPVVKGWLKSPAEVIALIKPQFEAGRAEAARGDGVIRDPAIHQRVVEDILAFAQESGFEVIGCIPSPLIGPKGNVEFLVALRLA
jgi:23S rRNA (cytidine1920-2'-O)/16S rRNA (cytidine1409-2'-O)-methyltransferase